jgi:hypothetical protein
VFDSGSLLLSSLPFDLIGVGDGDAVSVSFRCLVAAFRFASSDVSAPFGTLCPVMVSSEEDVEALRSLLLHSELKPCSLCAPLSQGSVSASLSRNGATFSKVLSAAARLPLLKMLWNCAARPGRAGESLNRSAIGTRLREMLAGVEFKLVGNGGHCSISEGNGGMSGKLGYTTCS